jgi:hypothetical protein
MVTIKGQLVEQFEKKGGKGKILVFYVPQTGVVKGFYRSDEELPMNEFYIASGRMIIRNNEAFIYFNEVELDDH